MPKSKPLKPEIARFQVLNELGMTPNKISKETGRDAKTIRKYLDPGFLSDPVVKECADAMREREMTQLELLSGIARRNLFDRLVNGGGTIIENTAVLDRTFRQKIVLEQAGRGQQIGRSNIEENVRKSAAELDKLLKKLGNDTIDIDLEKETGK